MVRVAVLDDYQNAARRFADWTALEARAEVTLFHDNLSDPAAVVERLRPFDAICLMRERTPLPRAILEQLPNLKLISSTGARNASIDTACAKERGITVSHTGYMSHGAMEVTWALILAAARHVPQEVAAFRSGGWQQTVGIDLKGSTLAIMGLGRIGSAIARIGLAFEMDVIAWSPNLTDETAAKAGARRVDKDTLLRTADFLTVHLVLSPRSRGVIGAAELAQMKPTAWLVNTSRGPLVDEAAMIDALDRKAIAGAALDVYDTEPLPKDHPLRSMDRVLGLPHVGFVTQDTYDVFYKDSVANVLGWMDGKPLRVAE